MKLFYKATRPSDKYSATHQRQGGFKKYSSTHRRQGGFKGLTDHERSLEDGPYHRALREHEREHSDVECPCGSERREERQVLREALAQLHRRTAKGEDWGPENVPSWRVYASYRMVPCLRRQQTSYTSTRERGKAHLDVLLKTRY